MAIVQRVGPRISDGLSTVGLVVDGEVGHVLLDVLCQLCGGECHSGDVVHALGQLAAVRLDELQSSAQTVGHVHHGERGVGAEEAGVVVVLDGLVEDVDRVVSGATARQSLVRDDSRVSAAAEVQTLCAVIVLAQQLQMHLRHAVHGGGTHDGLVGSHLLRSRGTERTDSRRNVQTALVLTSHVDHVLRTVDIHLQSLLRHLLAYGRQKGAQMDNPSDPVLRNQTSEVVLVSHIQVGRGARGLELSVGEAEIRGDHIIDTVLVSEN